MTIGDRVKLRRKELGLSVDDLSERLGKNRATIYRYERGDIESMPVTILEPLAKALHTTPAALMGWDTDTAVAPDQLRQDEVKLLGLYNELNELGQNKVIEDTEDLTHLPKYTEREKMRNA